MSNPRWREKLEIIAHRIEDLRTRFQVAVRNQELYFRAKDGFYAIHNHGLPHEMDAMRESIIALLNQILMEANLEPIQGMRHLQYP